MRVAITALLLLCACVHTSQAPAPVLDSTQSSWSASSFEAPGRLVAIGDLHGDLVATKRVLRLVGAIDESESWIGGNLTVVQVGDQIDRGPHEKEVLDFLAGLETAARDAGGRLLILNGNHEVMNVAWDFRYVPDGGWAPFDQFADSAWPEGVEAESIPPEQRGRHLAFSPGGVYATRLSEHKVIAIVGDTLFVHGGVLPEVAEYGIDRVNAETSAWMRGDGERPDIMRGDESPIWSRHYSMNTGADDCVLLEDVLDRLSLRRMVVSHTVQIDGITSACSDRVWRIDTGMSKHYGGPTQALEILPDGVRVLE
jgi:hypothetical protein